MRAIEGIRATNGRFFSVVFVKRTNGEVRKMNGRLGVQKDLKGVGLKFNPESKGLITCFDMQKKGYRMIDTETVQSVDSGKIHWRAA